MRKPLPLKITFFIFAIVLTICSSAKPVDTLLARRAAVHFLTGKSISEVHEQSAKLVFKSCSRSVSNIDRKSVV